MGDIMGRAQMTEGTLYYHNDSMDPSLPQLSRWAGPRSSLTFGSVCQSAAPALERLIHSTFVIADRMAGDKVTRAAARLTHTLGHLSEAAAHADRAWLSAMAAQLTRIDKEGDLREDVDPDAAADTIVAATIGSTLLSAEMSDGTDLPARLLRLWRVLLAAIVPEDLLPYLREFLHR